MVIGKKLERIQVLTPKLLDQYVFVQHDYLKLIRQIGILDILVANDDFQHKWMGVPGRSVASAAQISDNYNGEDKDLLYMLGGKSLNSDHPKFTFKEKPAEQKITLGLLLPMLLEIGRSGIQVFDPYDQSKKGIIK